MGEDGAFCPHQADASLAGVCPLMACCIAFTDNRRAEDSYGSLPLDRKVLPVCSVSPTPIQKGRGCSLASSCAAWLQPKVCRSLSPSQLLQVWVREATSRLHRGAWCLAGVESLLSMTCDPLAGDSRTLTAHAYCISQLLTSSLPSLG